MAYRFMTAKQPPVHVICKLDMSSASWRAISLRAREPGALMDRLPIWSQRPKNGNEVGAVVLILDSKGLRRRGFSAQSQKKKWMTSSRGASFSCLSHPSPEQTGYRPTHTDKSGSSSLSEKTQILTSYTESMLYQAYGHQSVQVHVQN